jgi:hypothetical protein
VLRRSLGGASACCKAGPSSILGSAPQEASLAERRSDEDTVQEEGPRQIMKDERMCDCIVRMSVKSNKMFKTVA